MDSVVIACAIPFCLMPAARMRTKRDWRSDPRKLAGSAAEFGKVQLRHRCLEYIGIVYRCNGASIGGLEFRSGLSEQCRGGCDMTFTISSGSGEFSLRSRVANYLAPAAASTYPLTLSSFHASVNALQAGSLLTAASIAATLSLALAFGLAGLILITAMSLAAVEKPNALQLRAKQVAFLSVAAPTIFVFMGVLLYMAGNPVPDEMVWSVIWVSAIFYVSLGDRGLAKTAPARAAPSLRVAHGVSALAIILLFLGLHLSNHLVGLAGPDAHAAVMKVARIVYRAKAIEPVLVGLFLFQAGSGLWLIHRSLAQPMDRFRAFQLASGMYLAFYVVGHMDSVFIYARTYLGVDTTWVWASGGSAGLIRDAWNVRLIPHYWLGVFFVLAHLSAGLRVVLLAHGWRKVIADRIMISGSLVGGLVATLIMLAMCGMRVHFV
jgi:hypothetical protein